MEDQYNNKSSGKSELIVQYEFLIHTRGISCTHKWKGEKKLKLWDSELPCNRAITKPPRANKKPCARMGCFFWSCWPVRTQTPNIKEYCQCCWLSFRIDNKTLLLKTPYIWVIKWLVSRWAHWYNPSLNSTEVINHFLIGFSCHSTRWNPYLALWLHRSQAQGTTCYLIL